MAPTSDSDTFEADLREMIALAVERCRTVGASEAWCQNVAGQLQLDSEPDQPVVGVSWDDACAFCEWAGGRLPTEAEWEHACRAGTTTEYSFGHDPAELKEYGWFYENSGGHTQPVGARRPNPWGLYDMHGNVWEWCQDWFSVDYYAESPESDPTGPREGRERVLRGGGWSNLARSVRSAYRYGYVPGYRGRRIGFRCARVPR